MVDEDVQSWLLMRMFQIVVDEDVQMRMSNHG